MSMYGFKTLYESTCSITSILTILHQPLAIHCYIYFLTYSLSLPSKVFQDLLFHAFANTHTLDKANSKFINNHSILVII